MVKLAIPNKGGGKFRYQSPAINIIDIAVEKGFATSGSEPLPDAGYDNAWTDED